MQEITKGGINVEEMTAKLHAKEMQEEVDINRLLKTGKVIKYTDYAAAVERSAELYSKLLEVYALLKAIVDPEPEDDL